MTCKYDLATTVLLCVAVTLAGCAPSDDVSTLRAELAELRETLQARNQTLASRVQYLEDLQEIQKVQAKYAHMLFTQRYDRIVDEVYAHKSPEVSVEFSDSGVYRGLESITRLYAAFEQTRQIPGFFIMHTMSNPYIEVAADGLSARSHWMSPGATGSNTNAGWVWGPYYVDYVKEDGHWRILHSNLAALVRTRFDVSWANATDNGTVRTLGLEPDAPPTLYRPYAERKKEKDMFRAFPDLPAPY